MRVFFAKKVYIDVPHAIGGAWAHFRRTHYSWALSKRLSARSRRAMAVAPMFFYDLTVINLKSYMVQSMISLEP